MPRLQALLAIFGVGPIVATSTAVPVAAAFVIDTRRITGIRNVESLPLPTFCAAASPDDDDENYQLSTATGCDKMSESDRSSPTIDEVLEIKLVGNQFVESLVITLLPISMATVSFASFPFSSRLYHEAVELLGRNKFQSVDDGELQWEVILPALNGVVMAAISILLANLVSTTFITLRNRQMQVHSSLNAETEDIRCLIDCIEFYPEGRREIFRSCLRRYIKMIADELLSNQSPQRIRLNSGHPMLEFKKNLHIMSCNGVCDDATSSSISPTILQQSYQSVQRIIEWRTSRITALQSTFPALHYFTIISLMVTMLLVFLMETDRSLILFLNSFQLRLTWGILVGTFTSISCIGFDLANPFIGTYQVPDILDEGDVFLRSSLTRNQTKNENVA